MWAHVEAVLLHPLVQLLACDSTHCLTHSLPVKGPSAPSDSDHDDLQSEHIPIERTNSALSASMAIGRSFSRRRSTESDAIPLEMIEELASPRSPRSPRSPPAMNPDSGQGRPNRYRMEWYVLWGV